MSDQEMAISQALRRAVEHTLENLAFLAVDAAHEVSDLAASDASYWATIETLSPKHYKVLMVVSTELAHEVCGSMGGAPDDEKVVLDCVAELVNVLAGRFLDELGDEGAIELGLPERGQGLPAAEPGGSVRAYDVGDSSLAVQLCPVAA